MSDDENGAPRGAQRADRVQDDILRDLVQVRTRLVQDDEGGVREQHPGEGEPLPLTCREPHTPITESGVPAIGKVSKDLRQTRGPGRRVDLDVRHLAGEQGHVVADRAGDDDRMLPQPRRLAQPRAGVDVGQSSPSSGGVDDSHGAYLDSAQPQHNLGNRGLAASTGSHQCRDGARTQGQGQTVRGGPVPPLVPDAEIADLDGRRP